jgi:hypothetical protein
MGSTLFEEHAKSTPLHTPADARLIDWRQRSGTSDSPDQGGG